MLFTEISCKFWLLTAKWQKCEGADLLMLVQFLFNLNHTNTSVIIKW